MVSFPSPLGFIRCRDWVCISSNRDSLLGLQLGKAASHAEGNPASKLPIPLHCICRPHQPSVKAIAYSSNEALVKLYKTFKKSVRSTLWGLSLDELMDDRETASEAKLVDLRRAGKSGVKPLRG